MKSILLLFTCLSLLGAAPFQCAKDPDPNRRLEDTPSEALWRLSEQFRQDGDEAARRATLTHLTEQYPTSREAERARMVLAGDEVYPDSTSDPGSLSDRDADRSADRDQD